MNTDKTPNEIINGISKGEIEFDSKWRPVSVCEQREKEIEQEFLKNDELVNNWIEQAIKQEREKNLKEKEMFIEEIQDIIIMDDLDEIITRLQDLCDLNSQSSSDKDKICDCGDHTKNQNGICDTCKLCDEIDKEHKEQDALKFQTLGEKERKLLLSVLNISTENMECAYCKEKVDYKTCSILPANNEKHTLILCNSPLCLTEYLEESN